ncbi:MAG TPA: DUF3105 domain-containing protein [Candidatus Dormibacteraeota bacterium]|nr:DUF3105 domain-containing protein [Candidatus Dormibacteraeota bacterium]
MARGSHARETEGRRDSPSSRKLVEKRARREERAARRKRGRDWTPIAYVSVIVTLMLVALVFMAYSGSHLPKSIDPAVGAQQHVGEQVPTEQANHIPSGTQARYLTDPPTSGPHYNVRGEAPLPWGFYARAYPPEDWVHNLEHGGVVILYDCPQPQAAGGARLVETDLSCPDSQSPVQSFISSAPTDALFHEVKIVATPYPVPGHRFAIVAWGWRRFIDAWDSGLAETFYEAHVDNGPERIP